MATQKTWHEKHQASLSFDGHVADAVAIIMISQNRKNEQTNIVCSDIL